MDRPKQDLILITEHYPCGAGEEKLEREIPFLQKQFQVSVVTADAVSGITCPMPEGLTFSRIPLLTGLEKIRFYLSYSFSPVFWRELQFAKEKGFFSWSFGVKTLRALVKSRALSDYLLRTEEGASSRPMAIYCAHLGPYAYGAGMVKEERKRRGLGKTAVAVRCHEREVPAQISDAEDYPLIHSAELQADVVFCDSEPIHSRYVELYASSNDPSKYRISRPGSPRPQGRNPQKEPGVPFHLLTVSSTIPERLAVALTQLKDGQVHWTHIGGDGDPQEKKERIAGLLAQNPLVFWEQLAWMDESARRQYYTTCPVDCMVDLELHQFYPELMIECMSYGIFAVARSQPSLKELVDDKNGLLVPADATSQELAKMFSLLAKIPEAQLEQKKELAFQSWEARFCQEQNEARLASRLRDVLEQE